MSRTSHVFHAIATPLLYTSPLLTTCRAVAAYDRTYRGWIQPFTIAKLRDSARLAATKMVSLQWTAGGGTVLMDDLGAALLRHPPQC